MIGNYAFLYEEQVEEIRILNSVTIIENDAFRQSRNFTNITIPSSVTSIEKYAFRDCSSLTTVYYIGTEEQWEKITIIEVVNIDLTN